MTNEVANVNGNETQKLEVALKKVSAVGDRAREIARVADEVRDFAPSLTFAIPNGPCFGKDGSLYLAEQNRVLLFPKAEAVPESGEVAAFQLVKQGELIPPREESFGQEGPGHQEDGRPQALNFPGR